MTDKIIALMCEDSRIDYLISVSTELTEVMLYVALQEFIAEYDIPTGLDRTYLSLSKRDRDSFYDRQEKAMRKIQGDGGVQLAEGFVLWLEKKGLAKNINFETLYLPFD